MAAQEKPGIDGHNRVRIVLADDHQVVRRGLQLVLDGEPDFEVVAQAGDIESARRETLAHRPHVLLLDLNMPGGSAIELIPVLRAEAPETQIVVLTMQEDPGAARAARSAGALAYVLKEAADVELALAIRRAVVGEPYLNRDLAARLAAARTRSGSWD
jgi:two-component system, NarL family, response regulator NreC